jgi:hypothetical protein
MLFDDAPFETDDDPFRVCFDEVVEQRLHTLSIDVLAFEKDGHGKLKTTRYTSIFPNLLGFPCRSPFPTNLYCCVLDSVLFNLDPLLPFRLLSFTAHSLVRVHLLHLIAMFVFGTTRAG